MVHRMCISLRFPILKRTGGGYVVMLCCCMLLLAAPVYGQSTLLQKAVGETSKDAASPAPAPAPSLDEELARLDTAQIEAKDQYARAQAAEESGAPLQLGATPEEIAEQTRQYRFLVRSLERHKDALRKLKEVRAAEADLDAQIAAWQGFSDPKQATIDLADSLRDSSHAAKLESEALEAEESITSHFAAASQAALATAEQKARKAAEALDSVQDPAQKNRLQWLKDLADAEVLATRAALALTQAERQTAQESIENKRKYIQFVQRKISIASTLAVLTQPVLDEKLATIAADRKTLQKELDKAAGADESAQAALEQARAELKSARETPPAEGETPELYTQRISMLESSVEACKARADTARYVVESSQIDQDLLSAQEKIWRNRFAVAQNPSYDSLANARDMITSMSKIIEQWKPYSETNLQLALTLVANQRQQLASGAAGASTKTQAEDTLKAYEERAAKMTQMSNRMKDVEQLLRRWQSELEERTLNVSLWERLRSSAVKIARHVETIWDFELFTVEENGAKRSITASKVAYALLLLFAGLLFARRISALIRRVVAQRFHLDEGRAAPIQTSVYYLLILVAVFFALNTVKIPLTVFAFFGGALAIGVGFGAQNLINNFISGLLMLIERPIKVGDIISVDGVHGRISSIGARCSQVRRFDGIEILVPNSSFLEKNVTNWTLSDRIIRFQVSVGVAYGSPVREVSKLMMLVLEEHGKILQNPEPLVLFEDFGDNALAFTAYYWLELAESTDSRVVASDIRFRIDKLFREAGISIAYPQRDIHIDTMGPLDVRIVRTGGQASQEESAADDYLRLP